MSGINIQCADGKLHDTQNHRGFTLIELMITVAIVAILAAIAYPSYRNQILRAHRTEARNELLKIQVAQEKYFLQNNTYGSFVQIGMTSSNVASYNTTNGYYTISWQTIPSSSLYTAQAVAQGAQANDTGCTTLTIDQTGARTPTTGTCWSR